MLDKPQDVLVMIGLFVLIVASAGFMLQDVNQYTSDDYNTSFFTTIEEKAYGETGIKGVGDDSSAGLVGDEGSGDEASEDGFIVKSINSLVRLGRSWAIMENSMDATTKELGINTFYLTIIIGLLLTSFAVVIISWWRGR